MARGDRNKYDQQEQQQQQLSQQIAERANQDQNSLYQNLVPKLNDLYANAGYTPAEKASMLRGGLEATSGQVDAAMDRLRDTAARTGNMTGVNATAEQIARQGAQQGEQFQDQLGQEEGQARMNQQNQVLQDMSGLYGETSAPLSAGLSSATSTINQFGQIASQPGFWQRAALAAIQGAAGAATGMATGGASLAKRPPAPAAPAGGGTWV